MLLTLKFSLFGEGVEIKPQDTGNSFLSPDGLATLILTVLFAGFVFLVIYSLGAATKVLSEKIRN